MFCRNCGKVVADEAVICVDCGVPKGKGSKFCQNCGAETNDLAVVCTKCGVKLVKSGDGKNWLTALLLCIFLGEFGAHRFYVGKIGTGVLMLLTLGGLGIWLLIDLIMIITGSFKDKSGTKLARDQQTTNDKSAIESNEKPKSRFWKICLPIILIFIVVGIMNEKSDKQKYDGKGKSTCYGFEENEGYDSQYLMKLAIARSAMALFPDKRDKALAPVIEYEEWIEKYKKAKDLSNTSFTIVSGDKTKATILVKPKSSDKNYYVATSQVEFFK